MIKRLKPKSEFSRNVLTLMTGTTIAQAVTIAISPVLTRIFTPEEFGLFALYMSIVTIIAVIATGRYELAVMLPKKDEDAASLVLLSLIIAASISCATLLPILFFSEQIANFLGSAEIELWLYLTPASIFLVGAYNSLSYWTNRKKQYNLMSQYKVAQSASMATTQVLFGFTKKGTGGLIIGWFAGQLVALLFLARSVWVKDKEVFKKIKRIKTIGLARRYKHFPIINSWSAFLNTASRQVPIILLTVFFSTAVTGFFSLAQRILQIPMSLLGQAIGRVYFEKASRLKNDENEIKRITLEIHKKLLLIGFFPVAIILLLGDHLFALVFGEPWRVAGEYAQFLSVWIFFVFVSSPLSHLMTIYEKHIESVVFNILLFTSRIAVLIISYWLALSPELTIAIYGVAGAVIWLFFIFYLMKLADITYFDTAKQVGIALLFITPIAWYGLT